MIFMIKNNPTYKKECYLRNYGIEGFGVTPNLHMANNYSDEESVLVMEWLILNNIDFTTNQNGATVAVKSIVKPKQVRRKKT